MHHLVQEHVEERVRAHRARTDRRLVVHDHVAALVHRSPFQVAAVQQEVADAHLSNEKHIFKKRTSATRWRSTARRLRSKEFASFCAPAAPDAVFLFFIIITVVTIIRHTHGKKGAGPVSLLSPDSRDSLLRNRSRPDRFGRPLNGRPTRARERNANEKLCATRSDGAPLGRERERWHLVLLETPLDELRAADVHRADDVHVVVLEEAPAVHDEHLQRARQLSSGPARDGRVTRCYLVETGARPAADHARQLVGVHRGHGVLLARHAVGQCNS